MQIERLHRPSRSLGDFARASLTLGQRDCFYELNPLSDKVVDVEVKEHQVASQLVPNKLGPVVQRQEQQLEGFE